MDQYGGAGGDGVPRVLPMLCLDQSRSGETSRAVTAVVRETPLGHSAHMHLPPCVRRVCCSKPPLSAAWWRGAACLSWGCWLCLSSGESCSNCFCTLIWYGANLPATLRWNDKKFIPKITCILLALPLQVLAVVVVVLAMVHDPTNIIILALPTAW